MFRKTYKACAFLFASSLASGGCLFFGSDGESDPDVGVGDDSGWGDDDDGGWDPDPRLRQLQDCSDGLSDAEVFDNTQISDDYAQSLHEMVACGGLAVALCDGVVSGVIDAIQSGRKDATPSSWSFDGEGVYRTHSPTTEMTTRFYVAEDFEFAAAGELVTANLFLLDNYLIEPRISIDYTTGATELRFDGVGPLVELLGWGPNPQSPIALSLNDLDHIDDKLAALEFESEVIVADPQDASFVNYTVLTPRMPAGALLTGASPLEFELLHADAERRDLDQDLTTAEWTIEFAGGNNLVGASTYDVQGGLFDYKAVAAFDNDSYAQTTFSCR